MNTKSELHTLENQAPRALRPADGRWRYASNALKHGVFSETVVLPTEDPEEFEQLRTGLIAELQPSGSLEHDAVFAIAKLTWRKQRLSVFRKAKAAGTIIYALLTPHKIGG
jgi:hypothetical protein